MSAAAASPPAIAARGDAATARRRPGTLTIWRWELRKLLSQKRTYLGLSIGMAFPLLFVVAQNLRQHHGHEGGNIFFAQITQSGLATPVLTLLFEGAFFLPLAVVLVAGDIVATEDGNGTLKTILTRSVDRGQVFAAKALAAFTYAAVAVFLSAIVATVAGVASWGFHHVTTFSGSVVPPGEALLLVFAANACYLVPIAAVVSIGVLLSTATRNGAAAVVGTLAITLVLALIPVIPGLEGAKPYLLTTEYNAWQGLLRTPTDWGPILHSLWVCALYAVPCELAAYLVFLRRDVAGG
ncbi:MAG TPA: ABC transporter permease [Solirubrobacteraceae bacterium]|nr:ABC transporter permease [Solirubrobacteraceae bacterium]